MENIDDKLDTLISKLSRQTPELNDAGLLTDSIMEKIECKSQQSKSHFVIWIRAVSSSAAVLLLGLFLLQQNNSEISMPINQPEHFIVDRLNIYTECAQNSANYVNAYLCHISQNSMENYRLKSMSNR